MVVLLRRVVGWVGVLLTSAGCVVGGARAVAWRLGGVTCAEAHLEQVSDASTMTSMPLSPATPFSRWMR